ncbi:MAG: isocitrate lyase/phosphoenolpyruvate mutase family protein, partial [Actinobacteria bacterium]|nr:isocitrate lyase/phosphoenolpyruvate mutase family protein [Actinomycetota bacterium]
VYPIFLSEREKLTRFVREVAGPVNVVFLPNGMSLDEMAACGVARVTYGSGLFQANRARLAEAAEKISKGDSPY